MCEEKERFAIPDWAEKPPSGTHLDVRKNEGLIQKLIIDEKVAYYFGRNPNHCEFIIEHASSSRVHAMLLYHGLLKKFALVDLKSTHGTFVKGIRIAPLQPIFLEVNEDFSFGASTRKYIIRWKIDMSSTAGAGGDDADFHLPEQEYELENLTNYNTMQNRRVNAIPITLEEARRKSRPRNNVCFIEGEEVINPEDVDPTVGRFRNLVQTAVVGGKRQTNQNSQENRKRRIVMPGKDDPSSSRSMLYSSISAGSISAAPNLDLYSNVSPVIGPTARDHSKIDQTTEEEAPKKKTKTYPTEAWPGRKPVHSAI